MTIAYFDCFSGIAGDMTLGALLDCGVPIEALREGLSVLPVSGWEIEAQPVLKNGIHAMSVSISLHGVTDEDELQRQSAEGSAQEAAHAHSHNHSHSHSHEHAHDEHEHSHEHAHTHEHNSHSHSHEHSHEHKGEHSHGAHSHNDHSHSHNDEDEHTHSHSHEHSHAHGRSMAEIRALIESSGLSPRVKQTSLEIFGVIAQAEAKMHHSTPEEVHFHEIGGVDSLIDICGAAWCLDYLGVDEVYCSALPHSTGTVRCAHGIMPVPAPATLEMLRGAPFVPTGLQGEMITPTGAGIVAALSQSFASPPAFTPRLVGCGAGKKNFADRPNLLRIVIGEKTENTAPTSESSTRSASLAGLEWRKLSLLETNIDDMNPELWDHVLERLFASGALDAWLQPIQMKKNRPATTLSVLCDSNAQDAVLSVILRETTTLGVRVREIERAGLPRTGETVQTPWGEVRVKVARWSEGQLERAAPEYDDVSRLARENRVAAREVYQSALSAWNRRFDETSGNKA